MKTARGAIWAGLLLVAGCGSGARAETPPAGITWFVLHEVNGFDLNRDDPTDRPPLLTAVPEGVIQPVDVSHDGVTDWLIAWPDSAQFCGTGGCQRTLYVSGGATTDRGEAGGQTGGFTRAFDRQAFALTIGEVGDETRIEAWVHHLHCPPEREECRFAWAWDPHRRELTERPASDGETILDGAPLSVVDLGDRDGVPRVPEFMPQQVYDAWEASRSACLVEGAENGVVLNWSELQSTPDLNGDGRRDWVMYPAGRCDATAGNWAYQLWVTGGDGDRPNGAGGSAHLAWSAPTDHRVAFDISRPAATALDARNVTEGEPVWRPLRWDAASGQLKP